MLLDIAEFMEAALDLSEHPIKSSNAKIKTEYFRILNYLSYKVIKMHVAESWELNNAEDFININKYKMFILERLRAYQEAFSLDAKMNIVIAYDESDVEKTISSYLKWPWKRKLGYSLLCDIALIFNNNEDIVYACDILKTFILSRQQHDIESLRDILLAVDSDIGKFTYAGKLISQYHINQKFYSQPLIKVIVTGNMSTGKSTLINALIGKKLVRSSQAACTGNICTIYNKSFEDGTVYLNTERLNMHADNDELNKYNWNGEISASARFKGACGIVPRSCIIDTPGVDAALHSEHGKLTYDALENFEYDKLLYIMSADNAGTYSEEKHLKWVMENVDQEKIIFVLNKVDQYKSSEDDIDKDIVRLDEYLTSLGFKSPHICPISARFSLLLKIKISGDGMSEEDEDEYDIFRRKFKRKFFDMSRFYAGGEHDIDDAHSNSDEFLLSRKAGIYYLERSIYGGSYEKSIH